MATYATVTSLELHMTGSNFGSLTAQALGCIERAEARIDSVLARRYDLTQSYFQTTTATPPQVNQWTIRLGAGYLWQELGRAGAGKESMARGKGLIDAVTEELAELRDHELELVDSNGNLILDASTGVGGVRCNTTNYPSTFNEDDELNWKVSGDKLEDIADERD